MSMHLVDGQRAGLSASNRFSSIYWASFIAGPPGSDQALPTSLRGT